MFFINRKKIVTGIHIGADTVRLVQLVHSKDKDEKRAACASLSPLQGYFDSMERIKNTVQAITTCKNTVGRNIDKTDFTISCLSWPDVITTTFNLPQMSQDELEQALILEIEQICPFDISGSVIDYQMLGDEPAEDASNSIRPGILAISPQHTVQEHFSILRKAGLRHSIVDADCLALLNCYETLEGKANTALINIDMSHTIVALPGLGKAPFMRNIDYGGKNIINSAIRAKGMRKEDFTGTLRSSSADLSDDIIQALNKSCSNLAGSISRTLQFCVAENTDCTIERVLLTGELSLMPIIIELLDNELEWELNVWNPFEKISSKNIIGQDLLEKTGSAFAIAAGLAIRSPEYV